MAKQNLIIGGSINYGINQLKPWVLSAKEITTHNTDIVLICGNTSKETIEWLDEQGVFTVDLIQVPNIPIHVLRFLSIYDYLKDNWLNYNHVVTTDVKDVYFQTDPFKWLDYHNIGVKDMHQIVAGSECLKYKDESWGNENLMQCYGPYVHNIFKENEIFNVGVLGGSAEYIKDLVFNIFTNATNRPIPIVDQAVFNVLIQTQPYKDVVLQATQASGWACQAGTVADPTKMDIFRPNLLEDEPIFVDGTVLTSTGKPFCIVHQYDRVPEWKQYVMEKYKQEDPNNFFTYRTT
jgi:hypothetical protein